MNRPLTTIACIAFVVVVVVVKEKITRRLFPRRNDLPLGPDHDVGTIGCLFLLCLLLVCAIMTVALGVIVILRDHNH